MAERFGKNQKPLFVIDGPVKAKAYRSNFKPFQTLKFLDARKLKRVRTQLIEIGTIEAAGKSATLIAKVEKGAITRLGVQGCTGCEKKAKGKVDKKVLGAIRDKMLAIREGKVKLPAPIRSAKVLFRDINIPIWPFPPIVILIGGGDGTYCIAINIVGHVICYVCVGDMTWGNCI